ncbi:methyl-accepting chemotaxis protein [Motilimonas sp. E26]|uniref:HAMP domain-containing methyl-accepting chemotaxis protein n=1 Tax=Motilimonas sp. E26 TaxID=2865674 RepID=UPI001E649C31|nr:methyl-accepting chemotaxis protein [Motilimonas sp. E26]MCE0557631.1 methyl-accepting chemotaxis protein [Motilimonas sp. E26]
MKVLNHFSVSQKLAIAPIILGLILVLVAYTGISALNTLRDEMHKITFDLAPDTELASDISGNLFRLRITVKNYVTSGDDALIGKFNEDAAKWQSSLKEAYKHIQNPARVALLDNIKKDKDIYLRTFNEQVVVNQQKRNKVVDETLNVKGPLIEQALTKVMLSAQADGDIEAAAAAGAAVRNLLLGRLYVTKFLVENKPEQVSRFDQEFNSAQTSIDALLTKLENPTRRTLSQQAKADIELYVKAADEVAKHIFARNKGIEILDSTGSKVTDMLGELRSSVSSAMGQASQKADQTQAASVSLLLTVAGSAIVIGLLLAFIISRAVTGSLNTMNAVFADIAQGEGDLTKRIPVTGKDELSQLAMSFNQFAEKIQHAVMQVSESTEQLLSAADELTIKAKGTQDDIREQQSQAHLAASAMTEMSASASEVSVSASKAAELSGSAMQSASEGRNVVVNSVSSMSGLSKQIIDSSNIVSELQKNSDQIGTVLEVIRSIAEQTNLLALNAAIEAARAGEQGRGFAVVADEVRSLASRTQESTKEIQSIIQTLQQGSEKAFKAMQESCESAEDTVNLVQSAEQSLLSIVDFMSDINSAIEHISDAAGQQATVSDEISQNVNSVSEISGRTHSQAEETAHSAELLSELGQRLATNISQFKIR